MYFLPYAAMFVSVVALVSAVIGVQKVRSNRAFSITPWLYPLGIFVWGDAPILGLFWILVGVVCFYLNSLPLFFLIVSVFWLVRSVGETFYWFLQQFSMMKRNPPEQLAGYRFVKDESIWFMYQLFWQCMTVISIIFTIYFVLNWNTINGL